MKDRERRWVRKIRNGSRKAFKEVFYAYHPRLCRFAAKYVSSHTVARDVVQDVFLKLWKQRADWELQGSLKAYLYQAVRNQSLNWVRDEKTKREARAAMALEKPTCEKRTAEDQAHFAELSEAIDDAIAELPERRREAFVLHRRHDLTYREVAEVMNITPKTVENQIGRALKFLRNELSSHFLPEEMA